MCSDYLRAVYIPLHRAYALTHTYAHTQAHTYNRPFMEFSATWWLTGSLAFSVLLMVAMNL